MRLIVWFKRLFRKQGQRFVSGEIVQHKELDCPAKILLCVDCDEYWEYEVVSGNRSCLCGVIMKLHNASRKEL